MLVKPEDALKGIILKVRFGFIHRIVVLFMMQSKFPFFSDEFKSDLPRKVLVL